MLANIPAFNNPFEEAMEKARRVRGLAEELRSILKGRIESGSPLESNDASIAHILYLCANENVENLEKLIGDKCFD